MKKSKIIIVFFFIFHCINFLSAQAKSGMDFYSEGTGYFQKEDYMSALKSYNKAIDLLSKTGEAPFILAECYSMKASCKTQLDDFRGAIDDYTTAGELYNKISKDGESYASCLYYRGICKLFINNLDGACRDWSKSGELGNKESYVKIKEHCVDFR